MPNIKLELHEMIERIDDDKVLEAVHTFLSSQPSIFSVEGEALSQVVFEAMIDKGEEDISSGKVHDHEEVKAFFKQKLNG